MFFTVKVGDEVGYCRTHYGTIMAKGFSKVAKINGHGHIILEDGLKFDRGGSEYKVRYSARYLIEAAKLREMIAADEARHDVNRKMRDIVAFIESAKTGAGNYSVSDMAVTKAMLRTMVDAL